MPTIRKRSSGGWQAIVRLAGHPNQSQVFDTKARAAAWGHATEAKLREQEQGIVRATFQEAVARYIKDVCPSLASGANCARRLLALSKVPGLLPLHRQISEVNAADLSHFRDVRLAQVSIATVRKEMTIIQSVFESARRDWGMVAVNPIKDVKRPAAPPHRERIMSDMERDAIAVKLGFDGGPVTTRQHQVAVAMLLSLETAMRAGEMMGLTWQHVNLRGQYVSLPKTKNGDYRDVPLSIRAVQLIGMMQGIDRVHVFTLESASLDSLFRRARDKCGIRDLHFHDCRATALTNLSRKLDVLELARMVGHRDLKSLMIYYRPTASTLALKLG